MEDINTQERKKLIDEGIAYLEQLHDVNLDDTRLGYEVLYNMVCLGIEAVFTGVLLKHDCIIDHSGIFRLLKELKEREEVPRFEEWMETSKLIARFQSYCSLEIQEIKIPNKGELEQMFDFGFGVEQYAKEQHLLN